ncbi:MAG TPA: NADPH-dependent F420 reductase [Candidatus Acidoferrales bacterium]|nr:NADPH-dependent F420 reductase [Candidatus Acidoferrales bacterium]
MSDDSITIIGGTGDLGYGLALRWAKAGRKVFIGSRSAERAAKAADEVRDSAGEESQVQGMANADAVLHAWIVVIAVPFAAQAETLASVKEKLRTGQTVVICTVPLEAAIGGAPTRTLGLWAGSASELAARTLPDTVHVLAAFQNVSAHAMQELAETVDCDVIVCGDDAEVRVRLRPWVEAIPGCRFVDGGKLENARIVESLTAFLIGVNRRHKVKASGIRITGIGPSR